MTPVMNETLRKEAMDGPKARLVREQDERSAPGMKMDANSDNWGAMPEAVQVETEKENEVISDKPESSIGAERENSVECPMQRPREQERIAQAGKSFLCSFVPPVVSPLPYWSGGFSDISKQLAAIAAPGPRISSGNSSRYPYLEENGQRSTGPNSQQQVSGHPIPAPRGGGVNPLPTCTNLLLLGASGDGALPLGDHGHGYAGTPVRKRGRPRKVLLGTESVPPKKRTRRILPAPLCSPPPVTKNPACSPHPPRMVSPRPPLPRLDRPLLSLPSLPISTTGGGELSPALPGAESAFHPALPIANPMLAPALFKLPGWKAAPPPLPLAAIPPAPRPTGGALPFAVGGFPPPPVATPRGGTASPAPCTCSSGSACDGLVTKAGGCCGSAHVHFGCGETTAPGALQCPTEPVASASHSSAEPASAGPSASGSGAESEPEPAPYQAELEEARRRCPPEKWGRFDVRRRQLSGQWSVYCQPCNLFGDIDEANGGVWGFISKHLQPNDMELGAVSHHERCLQQWTKHKSGVSSGGGPLSYKDTNKQPYKEGPWTPEEDTILVQHVEEYGPRAWQRLRTKGLLKRHSSSCHLRWTNHLRPGIFRRSHSPDSHPVSRERGQVHPVLLEKAGNGESAASGQSLGQTRSGGNEKSHGEHDAMDLAQDGHEKAGNGESAVSGQSRGQTRSGGNEKSHGHEEGRSVEQGTQNTAYIMPALDDGAQSPAQALRSTDIPASTPGTSLLTALGIIKAKSCEQSPTHHHPLQTETPSPSEQGLSQQLELLPAAAAELAHIADEAQGAESGGHVAPRDSRFGENFRAVLLEDGKSGVEVGQGSAGMRDAMRDGAMSEGGGGPQEEEEGLGLEAAADSRWVGGDLPPQKRVKRERRRFDVAAHERGKVADQLQLCCQCGLETRRKTKDGCVRCGVPLCKLCFVQWHEEQLQAAALDALAVESERAVLHIGAPPAQYGSVYNLKPAAGRGVHLRGNLHYGTLKCVECWAQTGRKTQHGCLKCAAALCIYCFRPWHARHDAEADLDDGRRV